MQDKIIEKWKARISDLNRDRHMALSLQNFSNKLDVDRIIKKIDNKIEKIKDIIRKREGKNGKCSN